MKVMSKRNNPRDNGKGGPQFGPKKQKGFTTLEMAIVVLITGVIFIGAVKLFEAWHNDYKVRVTKERMAEAKDLLSKYIDVMDYLPCPAPVNAATGTAAFGVSENCSGGGTPGTVWQINGDTHVGALPVSTMRDDLANAGSLTPISDDIAFDGYGRRFTYAVSSQMAVDEDTYRLNDGVVSIVDTNGNSLTPHDPGSALYALLSHGADGRGGYSYGGVQARACNVAAIDGENCDHTTGGGGPFLYSLLRSTTDDNNNNDDFLTFSTKELEGGLKLADFRVEQLACEIDANTGTNAVGGQAYGDSPSMFPNIFGESCVTEYLESDSSLFTPALNVYPADRYLIYETDVNGANGPIVGISEGASLFVRATIPVRSFTDGWEPPVHAAIYLQERNDLASATLIGVSEIFNPPLDGGASSGGTGVALARNVNTSPNLGSLNIQEDEEYIVKIYVYAEPCTGCSTDDGIFVGRLRFVDHFVDGIVEITQIASD